VEDFNWLRARQSPNWSVIEESARPPLVLAPLASQGVCRESAAVGETASASASASANSPLEDADEM
jgi:hypothetical protein